MEDNTNKIPKEYYRVSLFNISVQFISYICFDLENNTSNVAVYQKSGINEHYEIDQYGLPDKAIMNSFLLGEMQRGRNIQIATKIEFDTIYEFIRLREHLITKSVETP